MRKILGFSIAVALITCLSGCVTVIVPGTAQPTVPEVVRETPTPPAPAADPQATYDIAVSQQACGAASATTTESDGAPGVNYYTLLQCFAWYNGGYQGAIDGYPDEEAWAGIQRAAGAAGYTGPIDGSLSNGNAVIALQLLAATAGYTGPIDGDPGPNTYRFSAALFNSYLAQGWPLE